MITKDLQKKLLNLVIENMLPEYKVLIKCKKKLKTSILNYIETVYITDKDRELIEKYPHSIFYQKSIRFELYGKFQLKQAYFRYEDIVDFHTIEFGKSVPYYYRSIDDIYVNDKEAWKKISKTVNKYVENWNSYINKILMASAFLKHKNTTITLIKKEFPELYKLYKP